MEFKEAVRRRRMTRHFSPQPVAFEVLRRIVEAATRGPSAGFAQGHRFVVITDAEMRKRVADAGGEPAFVEREFEPWLSGAPAHIVVCVDEGEYRARYARDDKRSSMSPEEWPVPYWFVDAGAALMLILLAAVDEGLSAGFAGVHSFVGLHELLGIPAGVTPIGVVTIGYPAPTPARRSPARRRQPASRVIFWNRWGDPLPEEIFGGSAD